MFLDKAYSYVVFQTLPAAPHFRKVAGKKLKIEAVVRSCSAKKVFLETSQNSLENTCARYFKLQALEHLFLKNTSGDPFCKSLQIY